VGAQYGAGGTPSAILIAADGTVGSPLAVGADQIFTLAAAAEPARADAAAVA
jgi:hypothetical protein